MLFEAIIVNSTLLRKKLDILLSHKIKNKIVDHSQ